MSQAEELLNSLSKTVPEHNHVLVDVDKAFVIDPVTRTIKNMTGGPLVLMQRDHKSSVYTFQLPRYIEGHDMSLCNRVKCHFNNIESVSETEEPIEHPDVVELTDLQVNPEDDSTVICSWSIPRQATWYAGALGFLLQYICVDDEDNETYEWHTDEFTDVVVKKSRHNDEAAVLEYTAIFEQWRERIFGAGDSVKNELTALTEEKLSEVTSEGTKQVENVANEGLRVLNTIPADYSAMSDSVDMLTRVAGPVIRQETEGESIIVKDSAKMPLLGLQMFGKSEQFTTTGAQLIPYPYFNSNKEHNGITWTHNDDGSTTVSGTSTAKSLMYYTNSLHTMEAGTYTISGSDSDITVRIDSSDVTTGAWKAGIAISTDGTPVTFTLTEDDVTNHTYTIYASIESGHTVNTTIYPMLNLGETALPWEPYTGGVASPSRNYPQEIVSVENPTVYICGKNLVPPTYVTESGKVRNGVTFTYDNDGCITVNGTATDSTWFHLSDSVFLVKGRKYTLHGLNQWFNTTYMYIKVDGINYFDYGTGVTFEANKTGMVNLHLCLGVGVTFENVKIKPQVEMSEIVTDYEPYKEVQTITIPRTFTAILLNSGCNYVDSDGKRWSADYVDFESGEYVVRNEHLVLTGDENWVCHTTYTNTFTLMTKAIVDLGFCSHYQLLERGDQIGNTNGIYMLWTAKIYITDDRFSDLDSFKAWLAEEYANGTPVTIVAGYVNNNSIRTPIPEAELQAYRELHTNYPNTTILNDSGAHMKLAYATDTKMYIDNKFAELQALLTSES